MTSELMRFGAINGDLFRQSIDDDRGAIACNADCIVGIGRIDSHGVRLAIPAAAGRCQVDGDQLQVRSGQVVDDDVVGAPKTPS